MTRSGALPIDRLSPAERRVLDLLLQGRATRDIARALTLSEATVRTHLGRIYAKLGVRGRSELLARVAAADRLALAPTGAEDVASALGGPPAAPGVVTTATIALSMAAVAVTPKAAALFGPLLLVLGVRLPVAPGNLSGWLRGAAIFLGLALWVMTVWLVIASDAP